MVGTYQIDGHPLRLQLEWELENAILHNLPNDPGATVARIGCRYGRNEWQDILERVIHEAMEFMFMSRGLAHEPWGESGNDSANRIFIVSHVQFQAAVHFLAYFLDKALLDVQREWKALKKAHGVKP